MATKLSLPDHPIVDDLLIRTTLLRKYISLDQKFRQASRQMVLIGNKLSHLETKYNQAFRANQRSFRYTRRIQMATLEGVQNMFYEFAVRCCDELESIQIELDRLGLIPLGDGSEVSDSEMLTDSEDF